MKTLYKKISFFLFAILMNASVIKAQPSTTNLELWLNAGAGITKDNNNYVSNWNDQSTNAYKVQQSNLSQMPSYVAGAINGNPALNFDGIDDVLKGVVPVNGAYELTFF